MVKIEILKYEQGVTFLADEHPIVNDKDYCDVITTKATLTYSYDGCECGVTGDAKDTPKDILIAKAVKRTIFEEWYEENWSKTFQDIGMKAPIVYDYEDDITNEVNGIDNFISNCKYADCYNAVIQQLTALAEKEIEVEVIDKGVTDE